MSYAIFFDKNNVTYRLPVNPEELEIQSNQATEKYNILKLGEVVVPTHNELKTYTFETEFPHEATQYVTATKDFKGPDFWLDLFETWRNKKEPIRFIATNGITKDINTLVLIESYTVVEKAGEEGDKYVSFELIEYKEFSKKVAKIIIEKEKPVATPAPTPSPAPAVTKKTYTIVSGDTLWGIAKRYYGNGALYTKIYEANKSIIKNPNLIYPGQKVVIP